MRDASLWGVGGHRPAAIILNAVDEDGRASQRLGHALLDQAPLPAWLGSAWCGEGDEGQRGAAR